MFYPIQITQRAHFPYSEFARYTALTTLPEGLLTSLPHAAPSNHEEELAVVQNNAQRLANRIYFAEDTLAPAEVSTRFSLA